MRILQKFTLASVLLGCSVPAMAQEEGYFGPISRWSGKAVEPGVVTAQAEGDASKKPDTDAMKKMVQELGELRDRLRQMEENQGQFNQQVKTQFGLLNETLRSLQNCCDKLQQVEYSASLKPAITPASAVTPVKTTLDEASQARLEACMKNLETMNQRLETLNKKYDDTTSQLQEVTKMNLQLQANTRDLNDLKKKYETQERDLIQAQSDIGKLQQDMARAQDLSRANVRSGSGEQYRSSMALPLPPETASSTITPSRSGFTPAASAMSNIRLVNNYPSSVTVVVDGFFYTLLSNQTLTLNKAPGYFTYEVLGIQGNTLRTLGPAETMTIQIVPR
ncbi:MAG TPA: hypothetical protein PKD72_07245 [Gemmatales bacterium]|nr:hypothetical protein [Gemmatales bacterium]